MKTQPLEKLKPNLKYLLILIYKYRFLNRIQIQTLLNHKHFNRVIIWLNELTKKKYLKRYYSQKFAGSPAFYSLGTKGRKYFKEHEEIKDIKISLLDRVWAESNYTYKFKKHCMFVCDIYLSLVMLTKQAEAKLNFYTKTDLYKMKYLIHPEPDAYFSIEDKKGITKRYFLDIFDEYPNWEDIKKRIMRYVYYCKKQYWQDNTNNPFPEIIFICPNNTVKNSLNNFIAKMLENQRVEIVFYISTWDEIKNQGMKRQILHKVKVE